MARNRALLLAQQERLHGFGDRVPGQAGVFHRARLTLLGELGSALSWRGIFSVGDGDERTARVEALVRVGEGLVRIFERAHQIQTRLDGIKQTLARIRDRRLAAPDCVPTAIDRVRDRLQRLGREAKIDDDLIGELRRCDALQAETHALAEAVEQWVGAEEVLDLMRSQTLSGPLAAALPELGERLCRDGPKPEWLADLQELLGPLERQARREQPVEIRKTNRIIRDLPRWVDVLGKEISEQTQDAARELERRFKAKRQDCKRTGSGLAITHFAQVELR